MAALPISVRDIITPYSVYPEQKATVVPAANNRVYVTSQGGYRYRMTLNVRPFTVLRQEDSIAFEALRIHLARAARFEVPMINLVPNGITPGSTLTVTPLVNHNGPGMYDVNIAEGESFGTFGHGQYIQFSNRSKAYQIFSHTGNNIKLIHPLRHNLIDGGTTTINYAALDANNTPFNGIMGSFVNEDFGNVATTIDSGVLAKVNQLSLIESV